MQDRPLSGIRVLDLTNVLAGPYCSYQLELLGAEVVKIEMPGQGDLARHLGSDPELNEAGLGASFLAQNAGKKSVELDLKDPGRPGWRSATWSRGADVLLENFRAGVLARMGFGWPVLRELNPRPRLLRHLRLRPDRADAPRSRLRPGHPGPVRHDVHHRHPADRPAARRLPDLRHRGRPDGRAGHLGRPGRPRAAPGEGCFLDVSMLEAAISAMGWTVSNYLVAGVPPEPMGDQNATAAPSGTFDAADGPLNIAANRQEQFETLCRLVGRPGLIDDPRFADREARKRNRARSTTS